MPEATCCFKLVIRGCRIYGFLNQCYMTYYDEVIGTNIVYKCLLPEARCCCYKLVIFVLINMQYRGVMGTNISICCLRLFVVVYKLVVMRYRYIWFICKQQTASGNKNALFMFVVITSLYWAITMKFGAQVYYTKTYSTNKQQQTASGKKHL